MLPENIGDERRAVFRCPVCTKNHFLNAGEFVNGTIEFECPDNATTQAKEFHGVPRDSHLFPTDGTRGNPTYANPYSTRENAYKNPTISVREVLGRNTRHFGGKRNRNW